MFKIVKNKKEGICPVYRCSNKIGKKKRFCHKHHARYQKETNLLGYTYSSLKQNAKHRSIPFKLTLNEFREFCEENNYLSLKGKTANSASIDRIEVSKGYEKGNLQVLSLSANSIKRHEVDYPF